MSTSISFIPLYFIHYFLKTECLFFVSSRVTVVASGAPPVATVFTVSRVAPARMEGRATTSPETVPVLLDGR